MYVLFCSASSLRRDEGKVMLPLFACQGENNIDV